MSGVDLFSPFILAQLQQDPTLLAALSGGGGDNAAPLYGGGDPLPPLGVPAMTQAQQQDEAIRLGQRLPFPPGTQFNSRGFAVSPDLFKPDIGGAAGGEPDLGTAKISPEIARGWQQANAAGRNLPPEVMVPSPGAARQDVPLDVLTGNTKVPPDQLAKGLQIDLLGRRSPYSPLAPIPLGNPPPEDQGTVMAQGPVTRSPMSPFVFGRDNTVPPPIDRGTPATPPIDRGTPGAPLPIVPAAATSAVPGSAGPAVAPGTTPMREGGAGAGGFSSNALLQFLMQDMMRNRQNSVYDKILELGLGMMASKNPSIFGQIGEGGLLALKSGRERESADMKSLLEGAQISNYLSEAQQRNAKQQALDEYYSLDPRMAFGEAGTTTGIPSGDVGDAATPPSSSQLRAFLAANGATPNQGIVLTSGAAMESNNNPTASHDNGIGYGMFGHNGDRLAKMREQYGPNPNWQQQALFALSELRSRPEGQGIDSLTTPEQLTDVQMRFEQPDRKKNDGNYAARLNNTRTLMETQLARATGGSGGSGEPAPLSPGAGGDAPVNVPAVSASAGGDPSNSATAQRAAAAGMPPLTTPTGKVNVAFARRMADRAERAGLTHAATYWNKIASAPENHIWLPNGTVAPIKGTEADPDVQYRKKYIESQAALPSQKELASFNNDLQRDMKRLEDDLTRGTQEYIAGVKSELDTKKDITVEEKRDELTRATQIAVAERKNELDIIKDEALQKQIKLREIAVNREKPEDLDPNKTYRYKPGTLEAVRVQALVDAGRQLPPGMELQPDGSVIFSGDPAIAGANEMHKEMVKNLMEQRKEAKAFRNEIKNIRVAENILDEGVYTGPLANWQLRLGEALNKAGLISSPTPANTRAYMAQRARATLALLETKALGSGSSVTEQDREYMRRIAGEDTTIPADGLRAMFRISRELAEDKITSYDADAKTFTKDPRMLVGLPPLQSQGPGWRAR
jgi:hypothetical protein